jgi:hypothetical protein
MGPFTNEWVGARTIVKEIAFCALLSFDFYERIKPQKVNIVTSTFQCCLTPLNTHSSELLREEFLMTCRQNSVGVVTALNAE